MKRFGSAAAFAAGILATTLLLTACPPPPPGPVYVRVGPPPVRAEIIGVAPGPEYVWVGGYWSWNSAEYVWVPGAWRVRPRVRARWIPPHWRHTRHGWYFVEGHWR